MNCYVLNIKDGTFNSCSSPHLPFLFTTLYFNLSLKLILAAQWPNLYSPGMVYCTQVHSGWTQLHNGQTCTHLGWLTALRCTLAEHSCTMAKPVLTWDGWLHSGAQWLNTAARYQWPSNHRVSSEAHVNSLVSPSNCSQNKPLQLPSRTEKSSSDRIENRSALGMVPSHW